jgi:hypothetical protein
MPTTGLPDAHRTWPNVYGEAGAGRVTTSTIKPQAMAPMTTNVGHFIALLLLRLTVIYG